MVQSKMLAKIVILFMTVLLFLSLPESRAGKQSFM